MSRFLRAAVLFLAIAAITNLAVVAALPWLINRFAMHRIAQAALAEAERPLPPDATAEQQARRAQILESGGVNVALPARRADANARTVVRPSPDLLYTACVFDLSHGDLQIRSPVPEGYISVSGFAADTSNFFALNDADVTPDAQGQKYLEVQLTRDPQRKPQPGQRLVLAPSDRGLVLFRTLIPSEAALPRLQAEIQRRQECRFLPR